MRRRLIFAFMSICMGSLLLLGVFFFVRFGREQLPAGIIIPGAVDVQVSEASWRTIKGSYEAPLSYDEVADHLVQQMSDCGWGELLIQRNLGPSIFNPDPDPLIFQRSYWFGWMTEFVRVTSTAGPPSRVEVVVTRSIRWPPFVRWLRARL